MEFTCSICHYNSSKKENVTRHIKRKIPCGDGIREIIYIPIDINCEFCGMKFMTQKNLNEHVSKSCKKLKIKKNLKKDETQKLIESNEKLQEINKKLLEKNKKLIKENNQIKNKKIFTNPNFIRSQARKIYKQNFKLICVHCKNSENIEICHINAIKDFDNESTISEINNLENLIGLCPNCHKCHDKLKKFEVLRTSMLHSFIIRHIRNI
jgi:hypothetical protein